MTSRGIDNASVADDAMRELVQDSQRISWIGIDYFQALRYHQELAADEFKRIPANVSNILCVKYSPDGKYVAVSTADGCLGIYVIASGECLHFMNKTASASPATALRFRANLSTDASSDVLLAVYTNGQICQWNYITGQKVRHVVESENQLMTADYNATFLSFATAGKDSKIRIYDEATGTLVRELHGHSNRVFSLKFKPDNEHVLLSGGWDDNVKIWDSRIATEHQGLLFGPHICGDAIDCNDDEVLTGSWSKNDPLQLWDFRMLKEIKSDFGWNSTMIYSAAYSKVGPTKIVAGGTNTNEFRVFDRSTPNHLAQVFAHETEGSYTVDFSPVAQEAVVAGLGNIISVIDLTTNRLREFGPVGHREVPKW